ncbi:MAG: toxic anion resistance protein [Candidatus Nephthysia bennettiae]|uniref:Toxic anion resistance protein n=1 Tax=Candidatus Nephthysia bennettiae TaxID=3127016 RepID=A0A934K109_9BACT|nr:toxic anion resistance protein [Candidatus Dormibacteraeota bacterium]MBJ7611650.1 toxic anion resistance protein [Candidatus Dormibacteraeota bacterium]PZR89714.1 MAG: toxic anion resistance protein [Candidatus Dormibacteraeota bacterium]
MSEKQPESTAPEQALVLEPPKPVAPVTTDQAATSIEVPDETAQQISASVQRFVDELSALDIHSSDFQQKVDSIHQLGNQEIKRSSEVSNRFLERPAASLENGIGAGSGVSHSLVALRRQVEDLDPSRQDGFEHKILGIIPFGDGIRDYFHKYQSAQHNLDAILQSLYRGQDELQRDTVAIEQEKVNVWALKGRLEQYAYMAGKLDDALTAKIAQVQLNDPEKARSLQEDVLFYVRQKRQDLLTQLAVNLQGYLALDLVRKNDQELIKGVDRATTTTVSALRTAIIVSEALTNQKLVLDQVTAVNTTTSNLIESTSELLRQQSGDIQNQAASTTIGIEKLQAAFNNIYATMDMIDQYKLNALDTMQQTVNALSGEVQKAQTYVERSRKSEAGQATAAGELSLPDGSGDSRTP